jgi:hypothetical protein
MLWRHTSLFCKRAVHRTLAEQAGSHGVNMKADLRTLNISISRQTLNFQTLQSYVLI